MNKVFKLKFSQKLNQLVVVSEIAKQCNQKSSTDKTVKAKKGLFKSLSKLTLASLAAISFVTASVAAAGLVNPQVVHGSADIKTFGNITNIKTTDKTIINWDKFNVAANEVVNFNQPDFKSSVLNRVTGSEVSKILGRLQSNGKVFLVNPAGIVFGKDSLVNVQELYASTLNITDENFIKGFKKFEAGDAVAKVENNGQLQGETGVVLMGGEVVNKGMIQSKDGSLYLLAGQTIEIRDLNDANIVYKVTAKNKALNLGFLLASNVGLLGNKVSNGLGKNAGDFSSLYTEDDKKLQARINGQNVVLFAGAENDYGLLGAEDAKDAKGEKGVATNNGRIDLSSDLIGGEVAILADYVNLDQDSYIDARGAQGGKVILGGTADSDGLLSGVKKATQVNLDDNQKIDVSSFSTEDLKAIAKEELVKSKVDSKLGELTTALKTAFEQAPEEVKASISKEMLQEAYNQANAQAEAEATQELANFKKPQANLKDAGQVIITGLDKVTVKGTIQGIARDEEGSHGKLNVSAGDLTLDTAEVYMGDVDLKAETKSNVQFSKIESTNTIIRTEGENNILGSLVGASRELVLDGKTVDVNHSALDFGDIRTNFVSKSFVDGSEKGLTTGIESLNIVDSLLTGNKPNARFTLVGKKVSVQDSQLTTIGEFDKANPNTLVNKFDIYTEDQFTVTSTKEKAVVTDASLNVQNRESQNPVASSITGAKGVEVKGTDVTANTVKFDSAKGDLVVKDNAINTRSKGDSEVQFGSETFDGKFDVTNNVVANKNTQDNDRRFTENSETEKRVTKVVFASAKKRPSLEVNENNYWNKEESNVVVDDRVTEVKEPEVKEPVAPTPAQPVPVTDTPEKPNAEVPKVTIPDTSLEDKKSDDTNNSGSKLTSGDGKGADVSGSEVFGTSSSNNNVELPKDTAPEAPVSTPVEEAQAPVQVEEVAKAPAYVSPLYMTCQMIKGAKTVYGATSVDGGRTYAKTAKFLSISSDDKVDTTATNKTSKSFSSNSAKTEDELTSCLVELETAQK